MGPISAATAAISRVSAAPPPGGPVSSAPGHSSPAAAPGHSSSVPAGPGSVRSVSAAPISTEPGETDAGIHRAPDSPWSQPPHRPAPQPGTDAPGRSIAAGPTVAPGSARTPGSAAGSQPSSVAPHRPDPPTTEAPNGAIYRPPAHGTAQVPSQPGHPQPGHPQPGPPHPGQNQTAFDRAAGSQVPQLPGIHQPRPQQPGTHQPAPQQPGTYQPGPQQPGTQPAPHRPGAHQSPSPQQAGGQQVPAQPMPGPYPPAMDPRALPPHPQLHQPAAPQQPNPGQPSVDPFQDLPWVSDGTPTAEEFARRRMAKPAEPTATMGARAMLKKGTMGLVRLAPSRREVEYKQDIEMVRRNFGGLRQVTVVNPKGGAGKTVAVLLLAMTFGQRRGGYVLAWDNNETQGTLGMRAQQDFHARTVRDMMRDLHLFRGSQGRVGDLSQYVRAQGEGMFDVLASDESATAGEMLTAGAFAEIREIVSRFYKLIFVDTGNNVRAQNWQAAMDATDQLVITMSARNDSAETAARMLDHLEQSGRQRLVRQAVSVVTMPPTRKDIDLPAIQRHFAARTRAVLLAPYEKLIDSGEPLRYGQLSTNTKDAWLKIAAAVAEGL
ncbi:MAG TPA: chromosome partitioning protein [Actinoplanes sp.]